MWKGLTLQGREERKALLTQLEMFCFDTLWSLILYLCILYFHFYLWSTIQIFVYCFFDSKYLLCFLFSMKGFHYFHSYKKSWNWMVCVQIQRGEFENNIFSNLPVFLEIWWSKEVDLTFGLTCLFCSWIRRMLQWSSHWRNCEKNWLTKQR